MQSQSKGRGDERQVCSPFPLMAAGSMWESSRERISL